MRTGKQRIKYRGQEIEIDWSRIHLPPNADGEMFDIGFVAGLRAADGIAQGRAIQQQRAKPTPRPLHITVGDGR